jgi:hypothetical protein
MIKFLDRPDGNLQFAQAVHDIPSSDSLEAKLVREDHIGAGALEFWIGPPGEGAAYTLASEIGVHAYIDIWTGDRALVEDFVASAYSNRYLIELGTFLRTTTDDLVNMQEWAADVNTYVESLIKSFLHAQAQQAVELFGGDAESVDTLWSEGFFPVFGGLPSLRAVVAYSLFETINSKIAPEDSQNIGNLLEYVFLCGERVGLTLLAEDSDRILI